MLDREIPENDAAVLRTLCGFGEFAELPEKLENKYWEMRRICERDNASVTRAHLHYICFALNYGKPLPREANPTFTDLWLAGKVRREDRVIVKWRNGEKEGVVKRQDFQGRFLVQMDGDTEERPFEADKVRVAEMAAA